MVGNIYKITNNINGTVYVGKTHKDIGVRFKEHISDSKKIRCKNRPLYCAMNEFGIENFSVELIGVFEEDILEEKEIEYIKKYDSFYNGYNATLGGNSKTTLELNDCEVINKYKELGRVRHVANYFNCDSKMISQILKNNGKIISCDGYDNTNSKLSKDDIVYIRNSYTKDCNNLSICMLAEKFGVHKKTIDRILRNITYNNV